MEIPFLSSVQKALHFDEVQYVVLDLGASYIKAVYIDNNKISKFFVQKTTDNPVAVFQAWLKKEGFSSKEVKVILKGPNTLIRYITFPKVAKKNIKEVFSYEITKYIPFNKEDIYFDVYILDDNYSQNDYFVLLGLAKKDYVNSLIKQFQEANINITEISMGNVSLINLFLKNNKDNDSKNIALVDIGFSSTMLSLVKAGLPCLSREIKISTGNFVDKVMKIKDLDKEKAEEFIKSLDKPHEVAEIQEVLEIIEETAYKVAEEIKNSLDYFEVNWGGKISAIYITGGLSKVSGIDKVISNSLGIDTIVWNPFEAVSLEYDQAILEWKEMFASLLGAIE